MVRTGILSKYGMCESSYGVWQVRAFLSSMASRRILIEYGMYGNSYQQMVGSPMPSLWVGSTAPTVATSLGFNRNSGGYFIFFEMVNSEPSEGINAVKP